MAGFAKAFGTLFPTPLLVPVHGVGKVIVHRSHQWLCSGKTRRASGSQAFIKSDVVHAAGRPVDVVQVQSLSNLGRGFGTLHHRGSVCISWHVWPLALTSASESDEVWELLMLFQLQARTVCAQSLQR